MPMPVTIMPKKPETPATSEPLAVNVEEAARMLSVSQRSIWNMAQRGEIVSRRIGKRVVFPVASIHAFLEGKPEGDE